MTITDLKSLIAKYNFTVYAEGTRLHLGCPDDDYNFVVFGDDNLVCLMRDQGTHSGDYFIIDLLPLHKAFAKADRLFHTHLAE